MMNSIPTQQVISVLGLAAFIGAAWLMSANRKKIDWRLVFVGILLQFGFALSVLWTEPGHWLFDTLGKGFNALLGFVSAGSNFAFGLSPSSPDDAFPPPDLLLKSFAFGVIPTVIFFSSLMSVLYHFGVMQKIVGLLAFLMQKTLRTSGAESLAVAANVFIGQTEAPLVVRPYLQTMTRSELNALMVGGFSTISGGLLAIYAGMGIDPGHLLTASVISAPASLIVAKILLPETEESTTQGRQIESPKATTSNAIEAATEGATEGMKLGINIIAMLIAFLGLIAMLDALVQWGASFAGFTGDDSVTLSGIIGYLCFPIAFLMGIPTAECFDAGQLIGIKIFANEFIAYERLSGIVSEGNTLSPRTVIILTYALSGFSNFSSIGVQIGGISALASNRRSDLAKLGFKAMLGGVIVCCMTGCIAGMLTQP
ncbi:MAG: NupC/NupG family nucleoside CNT transporter [Rubripirellula sp.]